MEGESDWICRSSHRPAPSVAYPLLSNWLHSLEFMTNGVFSFQGLLLVRSRSLRGRFKSVFDCGYDTFECRVIKCAWRASHWTNIHLSRGSWICESPTMLAQAMEPLYFNSPLSCRFAEIVGTQATSIEPSQSPRFFVVLVSRWLIRAPCIGKYRGSYSSLNITLWDCKTKRILCMLPVSGISIFHPSLQ